MEGNKSNLWHGVVEETRPSYVTMGNGNRILNTRQPVLLFVCFAEYCAQDLIPFYVVF